MWKIRENARHSPFLRRIVQCHDDRQAAPPFPAMSYAK
ncbi:hypothetical protein SXCC_03244 [Gluconacetobacter sp. SXCC-1]|nr:hypothetical protein SXCC_03244 [Gluconacetobacter sp. SXCC-1]